MIHSSFTFHDLFRWENLWTYWGKSILMIFLMFPRIFLNFFLDFQGFSLIFFSLNFSPWDFLKHFLEFSDFSELLFTLKIFYWVSVDSLKNLEFDLIFLPKFRSGILKFPRKALKLFRDFLSNYLIRFSQDYFKYFLQIEIFQ